jgi:drug/metabolite transporter (DMT)-like permease
MTSIKNKNMHAGDWMLLIILSILWGASFFFGMVALAELPPFSIVLSRVFIAAAILNILVIMRGQRMPTAPRVWVVFLLMGALNNCIPFSLIFWAETKIPSGLASILNATTPLWTVLLAHLLTRDERLTLNKTAGILLGLLGVVTMIGWDFLRNLGTEVLAQIAILGATLSYALAGIFGAEYIGRRYPDFPPLVLAGGQISGSLIIMIPLTLSVDWPGNTFSLQFTTIAALLGLGVLSTVCAYLIYFRLLARTGASNVLLVCFLIPISALFLGIFVLGETISFYQVGGMALIGLGLTCIDGRILRKVREYLEKSFTKKTYDDYTI